ncbi:hypothetical protein KDA00_04000 [Candidatus Saccharibacteria bacterium]|nr:hypothetical protein [Candidatus Saccharibacteria bacterium]
MVNEQINHIDPNTILLVDPRMNRLMANTYGQDDMLENPEVYEAALQLATSSGQSMKTGKVYDIYRQSIDGLAVIDADFPDVYDAKQVMISFIISQKARLHELFSSRNRI